MDIIEKLTYFNLTRQEATLYLTLLAEGRLTGYEATKLTGISRSNTYTALAGLVEKGAAYVLEDKATRYTPVPLDEFCENRVRRLQELKEELLRELPSTSQSVILRSRERPKSSISSKIRLLRLKPVFMFRQQIRLSKLYVVN